MDDSILREQLSKLIAGKEAHVDWDSALKNVPEKLRGRTPEGSPHSLWEILEHTRIAQWDILEFSRNAKHVSPDWPSGYWPKTSAPPSTAAWEKSVKQLHLDREEMVKLVMDPQADIAKPLPHGSGQTILREALLVADHNSYHLGQFVLTRRLLNTWQET